MKDKDQALSDALRYYDAVKSKDFNVRASNYHYRNFQDFAGTILGDMARKFRAYLLPQVEAAGRDGLAIDGVVIKPILSSDGAPYGCAVFDGDRLAFRVTMIHTPASPTRDASYTVSILRAGADRSIAYATIHPPSDRLTEWKYNVYQGPGVLPGVVEACRLIMPFIRDEVAADPASKTRDLSHVPEAAALIDADGGLPGNAVASFAVGVLNDGTRQIAEWLAKAIPEAVNKLNERVTWPANSLVYNDSGEHFSVVRSLLSVGVVYYMPYRDEPASASITLLRINPEGEPVSMEHHVVPFGDGRVTSAIEEYIDGRPIAGHPSMAYDFASRCVSTTPEYLELKQYVSFAVPVDHCMINWRGKRYEAIAEGVSAFQEEDGVLEEPAGTLLPSMA